MSWRYR